MPTPLRRLVEPWRLQLQVIARQATQGRMARRAVIVAMVLLRPVSTVRAVWGHVRGTAAEDATIEVAPAEAATPVCGDEVLVPPSGSLATCTSRPRQPMPRRWHRARRAGARAVAGVAPGGRVRGAAHGGRG